MEFKSVKAETTIKGRIIEGYAAMFDNVDHGGDIIKAGAFEKTLGERGPRVKVFYNHNIPIGKPQVMKEDGKGLYTESVISKTDKGDEILELARDGVIDEMSFAYEAVQYEIDEAHEVRILKELKLYEYGPVDFAMNEEAIITGVKALSERVRESRPINTEHLAGIRQELKTLLDAIDRATGPDDPTPPDNEPSLDTRIMELPEEWKGRLAEAFKLN